MGTLDKVRHMYFVVVATCSDSSQFAVPILSDQSKGPANLP